MLIKLLGPVTLGFYQMAQRTASVPLKEVATGVSIVAFPVYSKVQDDLAKLRQAFLRSFEVVTSLSLPLSITIVLLAQDFTALVLGEKWLLAVPAIQVLAIAALIGGLAGTGVNLFMGSGRPWLMFQGSLLKAIALVAMIFPLTSAYGLAGAAYAVLIASSLRLVFVLFHSFSILRLQPLEPIKVLLPNFGVSAAIALVILEARQLLGTLSLSGLIGVIALALAAYGGLQLLLWWWLKIGLFRNLFAIKLAGDLPAVGGQS